MIEAKRIDTVLRGIETVGGGLYPQQIAKRKKQAKQEKRVCKGEGCITRISAYNRDKRGHPETLCYKCRSKVGGYPPTPEISVDNPEKIEDSPGCPHGLSVRHCPPCHREAERARNKSKAIAAGRPFVAHNSRVALYRLAEFMEKHEVTLNGLGKKTSIPPGTLRGYKRVGEPNNKGYTCPPERAEIIAEKLGVTVAVLAGEEEE